MNKERKKNGIRKVRKLKLRRERENWSEMERGAGRRWLDKVGEMTWQIHGKWRREGEACLERERRRERERERERERVWESLFVCCDE